MKIRFQINDGTPRGAFDHEHPIVPPKGAIVHLPDGEHAYCVVHVRHLVGGAAGVQAHVFLRDATRADIENAGG